MVREYIVKIADDVTEDDDVLYGKPAKELIRCKDCRKRGTVMCHLWFNSPMPKGSWYCADGERR